MAEPDDGRPVVVTVTANSAATIARSLHPLRACRDAPYVVVVDNDSTDDTIPTIDRLGLADVVICNATNRGYGTAVNQALAHLHTQDINPSAVVLLDPDCFITPTNLHRLASLLDDIPQLGAVSPTLQAADNTEQVTAHQFRTITTETRRVHDPAPPVHSDTPWLTPTVQVTGWMLGACLALRPEALDEIGGIAERYFVYVEDIDVCHRLQAAGWGVAIDTSISATHLGGHSLSHSPLAGFAPVLKLVNELAFYETVYRPATRATVAALRVLRQLRTGELCRARTAILALASLGLPAHWIGRAFLRRQGHSVRELIPADWLAPAEAAPGTRPCQGDKPPARTGRNGTQPVRAYHAAPGG